MNTTPAPPLPPKARLRVAVVQLCSRDDLAHNLHSVATLVEHAANQGAALVALPENFALVAPPPAAAALAEDFRATPPGPVLAAMSALARRSGIHLLLGGMPTPCPDNPQRVFNSALLLDPSGAVAAVYHKLHLFDLALAGGPSHQESAQVAPGTELVTVPLGPTRLGLSICYDLRFPELYRKLVAQGAELLCIPAAFTAHTGKDHWFPLLRARAIENQAYVLAPAQFGRHRAGRTSYGKSCIIDPWGAVIAQVSDGEGIALADLDLDYLRRLRREFPCLEHRRL